jgi:protein-L-isoaspartate(D-aspartate) O-methyltransferase
LTPDARVLEIGTGSAYQTAVLAELAATVHSIEIVSPLAERAAATLAEMGYDNVQVREGDGYAGWPEAAPFDAIMVTAAPDHVPQPLVDQLAVGGRMIIPVGAGRQTLTVLVRSDEGVTEEATLPVLFVPMTGEAERR